MKTTRLEPKKKKDINHAPMIPIPSFEKNQKKLNELLKNKNSERSLRRKIYDLTILGRCFFDNRLPMYKVTAPLLMSLKTEIDS